MPRQFEAEGREPVGMAHWENRAMHGQDVYGECRDSERAKSSNLSAKLIRNIAMHSSDCGPAGMAYYAFKKARRPMYALVTGASA